MTDQKPVTKRLRYEILRRDANTCRYCGGKAPDVELTVDHVIPTALGGRNDPDNLVAACRDCNAGKSSTSPDSEIVEGVTADSIRWAAAMQRAAAIRSANAAAERDLLEQFHATWMNWTHGGKLEDGGTHLPIPDSWESSVRSFLRAGLDAETLDELIIVAMNRNTWPDQTWRYFCGCCWRAVEQQQEIARALIQAEEESA